MLIEIQKIILPIIRRVAPNVIANDLLGVQPMTGCMWPGSLYPTKIWQVDILTYQFYSNMHPEILDWLQESAWSYTIWTDVKEVNQRSTLVFGDIHGAVEFKVRF
jgi:hypothetical protein